MPNELESKSALPSKRSAFASGLKFAGMQQAVIVPLSGLVLDGGVVGSVCLYAFAGYWVGILLLWSRRCPDRYTTLDLLLVRWGFFALILISAFVAPYSWRLKGFSP